MNKVKRAVIEFANGTVVEFTKPMMPTELTIWIERHLGYRHDRYCNLTAGCNCGREDA